MITNRPTDLQIKKFWIELGWKEIEPTFLYGDGVVNWQWEGVIDANKTVVRLESLPPIDLNSLFRYAVPKVQPKWEVSLITDSTFRDNGMTRVVLTHAVKGESLEKFYPLTVRVIDKDPADALFWAVKEVISNTSVSTYKEK